VRKRNILKRLASAVLAAGMIVSQLPATGMSARASEGFDLEADLLAHYPLESDVKDVSGNQKDAVITTGATGVDFAGSSLNLAGGDKFSPNYVTLPDGLFDNQNTVTVSMWINNHNMKGNYAAFFFGSAAVNELPSNYFLLNPCSPGGNYKAVFTNSVNVSTPWSTEVGINDGTYTTSTAGYMNQWKLYTIVISNKTLTGYLDGVKLGTTELAREVSDFGTGLKAHIGRSQYLNDSMYEGSFRDLRIYNKALDDADVKAVYDAGVNHNKLLEDKEALSIGNTAAVISDITLPAEGKNGSKITWTSDNTSAVTDDGKVSVKDEAQKATLTATLTLGKEKVTKAFEIVIAAKADISNVIKEIVQVPYAVTEKTKLPVAFDGGMTVEWNDGGQNIVAKDGTIKAPEKSKEIAVTAEITYGGKTYEKEMKLYVMEKGAEYVMSYTRTGVAAALGGSMHLAVSADGENYTALHSNTGIFFPKADLTTSVEGTTKTLAAPYLFRMADGKIGMIAARNDGKAILAVTEDLLAYEETILSLNSSESVKEPRCEYNGTEYVITWEGNNSTIYKNTTKDFKTISKPQVIANRESVSVSANITNAVPCNVIPVTKAEAEKLRIKLQELENTGVEDKTYTFYVKKGESLSEEDVKSTITAKYNDGTTDEIPVTWDLSSVDYDTIGDYTVSGKAKLTEYGIIHGRADPNIVEYNGKYYFIATGETQEQSQVCIREADTPAGLFTAQDHELIPNQHHPNWAPELHEINGKLYIFLAIGGAWNQVQSSIMELKEGGNPLVAADWKEAVRVTRADGSNLYDDGITLDMTCFEQEGTYYVCWAQRVIGSPNGTSDLWIATIDPDDPYVITSDPVCIVRCQYGWDRVDTVVDEGPFIIKNDGKIYLTFSGAGTGQLYVVGLLTAEQDADLLDPASWTETNYPILTSESVPGENGPGHSCFAVDEDGRDIFVYHMRPNGGTRSATVRRVHWAPTGEPVLDMTIDQELKAEYRNVTAVVKVVDEIPEPDLPEPELPYVDVEKDGWYYDAVAYNYEKKTMTGLDDTHFGPADTLVRAQFAAVLHKMNKEVEVDYRAIFSDVTKDDWFVNAVLWAEEKKIVTGYTGTDLFGANDPVTRAQMATMMYRYAKEYKGYDVKADGDYSSFPDAGSVQEFAVDALKWAVSEGIITGKTIDGKLLLDPQGSANRAECATIIQRFMEKYEK